MDTAPEYLPDDLTTAEAAAILGKSTFTVTRLARLGKLPYVDAGTSWPPKPYRFRRAVVEALRQTA